MFVTVQDHPDTLNRLLIVRHPICASAIAMLLVGLIADGVRRDVVGKTALYLTTIGLSILVLQLADRLSGAKGEPIRVYAPVTELLIFSVNAIVAFGFLWARFILDLQPASMTARLLFFGIGLGALFNVFLMIALTAMGYRPSELGMRLRPVLTALPILALFATLALGLNGYHISSQWQAVGWVGPLAGVSEEFFRFVLQTRLAALSRNRGGSWFTASSIWAAFHLPVFWIGSHSFIHAAIGCAQILPLGLLWGYLTLRTRSFLPAALLHGTNFWGLQVLG